jgi:predicted RNA-binding Zn-ribbon protein involved in translation (DUF1610 family)
MIMDNLNQRQEIELSDIFLRYKEEYLEQNKLCPTQQKAFTDILSCRTSTLGGHIDKCEKCGYEKPAYNSCRNRHCPKCQYTRQIQWVDKLKSNLLPKRHFHIVFTIPGCLHKLFYINQKQAYSLLFKASNQALKVCASNPKYLGAQTGAVSVLHTWGQTLTYHPHIHMIVPAGGLSEDGMEWINTSKKFFLPVKVLSALFRGILSRLLEESICKEEIKLPEDIESYEYLKKQIYAKKWVVYAKSPFASPQRVIEYLGNYTHRVAISNHRIISVKNHKVTFRYKNYRTGNMSGIISLDVMEFIKRFMQHILPSGFCKIRYFGILSQRNLKSRLQDCFSLFDTETYLPAFEGLSAFEIFKSLTGMSSFYCPKCGNGRMKPRPVAVKTRAG